VSLFGFLRFLRTIPPIGAAILFLRIIFAGTQNDSRRQAELPLRRLFVGYTWIADFPPAADKHEDGCVFFCFP
jgi:hypothetical protein